MAESSPGRATRTREKTEALEERVKALESAVKALLKGMQCTEEEIGEALMPEGDYFGIEFRD